MKQNAKNHDRHFSHGTIQTAENNVQPNNIYVNLKFQSTLQFDVCCHMIQQNSIIHHDGIQ